MSTPAVTATTTHRGLWRWAVALVATVALIVSGSGLVVFAQSGAGESRGPEFVSADAPFYLEVRLDMPAGQDEAMAQLLTAFPGFADAGSFDLKMDELVAGLGAQVGTEMPDSDLFGDVLTGEIGLAVTDLEAAMMGGTDEVPIIIGLAVANAELAAPVYESLTSGYTGADASEEMYGDTAILSDGSTAAAMHGDWVLLSQDVESVKASIDVLDGQAESLADSADFAAAFSRVPAGHLGAAWMDLQSLGSLIELGSMLAEGQAGVALPTDDLAALLPIDMIAYLVADSDRLTLDVSVTPGEMTPAVPVGDSDLATLFPADTQVYLEAREVGSTLEASLDQLTELLASQELMSADDSMGALSGLSEIEVLFGEESPITAMLGVPLPEFLDFVGDAGVGAGMSSDGVWLGIAAEVTDEAVAQERLDNLMTTLSLFTMQMEDEGISVETGTVGDVEITTIMVPMDQMMAGSGLPISVGNSISVAIADGSLLIGSGDFVQASIAGDATDSLGTSAGYIDALGDDTVNAGVMYVNVSSLLTALDPLLSMMGPQWTDIAPYASGFDRIIAVGTADDEVIGSRITVIVGQ